MLSVSTQTCHCELTSTLQADIIHIHSHGHLDSNLQMEKRVGWMDDNCACWAKLKIER